MGLKGGLPHGEGRTERRNTVNRIQGGSALRHVLSHGQLRLRPTSDWIQELSCVTSISSPRTCCEA